MATRPIMPPRAGTGAYVREEVAPAEARRRSKAAVRGEEVAVAGWAEAEEAEAEDAAGGGEETVR